MLRSARDGGLLPWQVDVWGAAAAWRRIGAVDGVLAGVDLAAALSISSLEFGILAALVRFCFAMDRIDAVPGGGGRE